MKILLGGSPCTYWSIAQKNNRETEPSGLGWELFENYLIAKEKFQPDIFLYENNKSAAQPIKDEIKKRLNVWDGTLLMPDSGARYIEINSALVSAQNRQRFYVHNCGEVEQPADRGILLRDILESGVVEKDKGYCLKHQAGNARDYFKKHHTNIKFEFVAEPVCVAQRGRYSDSGNRSKKGDGEIEQYYEAREGGKTNALTTVQKDNMVAEPVRFADINNDGQGDRIYSVDGKAVAQKSSSGGAGGQIGLYAEPIRIGDIGSDAQAHRVYSCDGKSRVLIANAGGQGGKTGLYACPVNTTENGKSHTIKAQYYKNGKANFITNGGFGATAVAEPITNQINNKTVPVYEVRNGKITIKDKQYPIKLADGFYIIRKLTVTECCRLQTMPDDYCRAVSASQAYKGLGNGWTAEVIIHILSGALKDVPRDEEIVVLSMYDGIGTGRYCLDKMGFTNVKYYAYEIDKYAIQIAKSNYPDIIECGDAFQVRNKDWKL